MDEKQMTLFSWLRKWCRSLLDNTLGAPPADCTPDKAPVPPPKISPDDDKLPWDGFTNEDDGTINTHHPVFQVGRNLYDAQVLYADAELAAQGIPGAGPVQPVTPERVMQLCKRYCQLVNALGQLRADYNEKVMLLRNLSGKRISDLMR